MWSRASSEPCRQSRRAQPLRLLAVLALLHAAGCRTASPLTEPPAQPPAGAGAALAHGAPAPGAPAGAAAATTAPGAPTAAGLPAAPAGAPDRKSTRLNSSH